MNEIFDRLTSQGSRFLQTLSTLVYSPRVFFSELRLDKKNAIGKALEFVVSCLAVSFIFQLPFVTSAQEIWQVFTTLVIFLVVTCLLISSVNKAGFQLVGGAASYKNHLIVTLYVTGPAYIIGAMFGFASQGLIMVHDPEMLPYLKKFIGSGALATQEVKYALFDSKYGIPAVLLNMTGMVLSLIWILVNWWAYRLINGVSRLKSFLAFCIAMVLLYPISKLIEVMRDAFNLIIFGIG